jgi:hypothetical protein
MSEAEIINYLKRFTGSSFQKRSFLREFDEQYPISPQSPNFVLITASQIQILKALLGAINWKLYKA